MQFCFLNKYITTFRSVGSGQPPFSSYFATVLFCTFGPEFPSCLHSSAVVCWICLEHDATYTELWKMGGGVGVTAFGWMCLEDDTTCTHVFKGHAHTLLENLVSSLQTRRNIESSSLASSDLCQS